MYCVCYYVILVYRANFFFYDKQQTARVNGLNNSLFVTLMLSQKVLIWMAKQKAPNARHVIVEQ